MEMASFWHFFVCKNRILDTVTVSVCISEPEDFESMKRLLYRDEEAA